MSARARLDFWLTVFSDNRVLSTWQFRDIDLQILYNLVYTFRVPRIKHMRLVISETGT
jgi:hypothetical protein